MRYSTKFTLYTEYGLFKVEFSGEPTLENDGIGSYEYWGSSETDKGHNYIDCEEITWDKSLYSNAVNEEIDEWLKNNYGKVVKSIGEVAIDSQF